VAFLFPAVEQRIETRYKAEKYTLFLQLNDRKLLVVFYSASSEGIKLYSKFRI
jgi:hypothetical protein